MTYKIKRKLRFLFNKVYLDTLFIIRLFISYFFIYHEVVRKSPFLYSLSKLKVGKFCLLDRMCAHMYTCMYVMNFYNDYFDSPSLVWGNLGNRANFQLKVLEDFILLWLRRIQKYLSGMHDN